MDSFAFSGLGGSIDAELSIAMFPRARVQP
jgi:hypothetical protein